MLLSLFSNRLDRGVTGWVGKSPPEGELPCGKCGDTRLEIGIRRRKDNIVGVPKTYCFS